MEFASTRLPKLKCGNDVAVTFIVHSSRGEEITTTIRLSVIGAITKGRNLMDQGWQVFITDADGIEYQPSDFDRLASSEPAGRTTSHPE
jgi:hypothetical protein